MLKTKSGLFIPYVNPNDLTVTKIGRDLQENCCVKADCSSLDFCGHCIYSQVYNTLEFIKFATEFWS